MPSPRARARSPRSRSGSVALGIDLGATKVVSGLVAADGRVVRHGTRRVHGNDGPDAVLEVVVRSARECLADGPRRPAAIGIAVAAQVDPRSGTVVHAPNLGWRDVPLARQLADELGGPVTVVNDARAATAAEWRFGAGVGVDDLFYLSLGTGVGGSAVVGGRLLEGGSHALGEVGHLTVVAGGRRCHCPNVGCLEAYVGGWAIAERAREAAASDPPGGSGLSDLAGDRASITAETVFAGYRAGDRLATEIVRETVRILADGAVGIVNAFNPSLLAVGGGLVAGMPEFVPAIASAVGSRCQPPAAGVRVVPSSLGPSAPMVGAADVARRAPRLR